MEGTGSDSNNNSLVLRLDRRQASLLFTGDLKAEGEALLLESGQPLAAEILKVAHHGSRGPSTDEFLAQPTPQLAIVSVGTDSTFGHPAPEVLERLAEQGYLTVLRTDEQGTIELVTHGAELRVRTTR